MMLRPGQYSLRSLACAVAVSALIFGAIKWLGVANPMSAVAIALSFYLGAVLPSSWLSRTEFVQSSAANGTTSGRVQHLMLIAALSGTIYLCFCVVSICCEPSALPVYEINRQVSIGPREKMRTLRLSRLTGI